MALRMPRWPRSAWVTFAALVVVLLLVAAWRTPDPVTVVVADLPPETVAEPSTTTTSTTVAPTTTEAPTTTAAPTTDAPATTVPPETAPPAPSGGPLADLEALPVEYRDDYLPYDRTAFGTAWTDNNRVELGRNGCRTRDDILARDLVDLTYQAGKCTVATGTLHDPYTAQVIHFQYGQGTSNAVQIDHIIPLHAAWQLGAWGWAAETRVDFANDPINLLAVDGPANMSKGDKLADQWMPPNAAYHCTYATKTVQIHVAYTLPVTPTEKEALRGVLSRC